MRVLYAPDGAQGGFVEVEESPFESDLQIDEVAEEAGPSREDLMKEFQELKKANEELKVKADSSSSLSQSFNNFGDRLEKSINRPAPPPAPVREQGETTEQFKERINRTYLEDPYSALIEFNNRHMGGAMQTLAEQSLRLQRKLAYMEAPDRDFVTKHQDEIEAELQNVPMDQQIRDPQVVNRTIDSIRARHMDEIVAQKVAAELQKHGIGGAPAPRTALGASEAPLVSTSAPSSVGAASAATRRVTVTPAKKARIMAQMSRDGLPQEKFNDYVGWLVEDGEFDRI